MIEFLARNAFLGRGYFISRLSDENEIVDVLQRLKPRATDKELIRIGGDGDGGYLVPDDLDGIEYCFSPGVARTASFETELARKGIRSFLADYSVEGPPVTSEMFSFEKKFLGAHNDHVYTTLGAWVERSLPRYDGDLLLQMDIEGGEYDVMLETSESVWRRFRIVIIEFHGLHTLFNRYGLKSFRFCFQKLLNHFEVVHLHPNNAAFSARRGGLEIPGVMEMTFLRKDRIGRSEPCENFPHRLDRPNVDHKPDTPLPDCWYR